MVSDVEQERAFQTLSIGATVASIVAAWFVAAVAGLRWDLSGFTAVGIAASLPLLAGLLLYRSPRFERLASGLAIFGLLSISIYACGVIAMVSTRTPLPLGDALLMSADSALGVSAGRFITIVAAGPPFMIGMLRRAYEASIELVIASIFILPLLGHHRKAWRFSAMIHITLPLCALIAFTLPAYGAFATLDPATVSALPRKAGRYFWPQLTAFRNAADPVISIEAIGGVVAFPSFHTILALLVAEAWSDVRYVNKIICANSALIIVAAIPMGGHYFVDVIAGVILWWCCSHSVDYLASGNASRLVAKLPRLSRAPMAALAVRKLRMLGRP